MRKSADSAFVTVSGNMGVGKTTVVDVLGSRLGWTVLTEEAEERPYLRAFYEKPTQWAFHNAVDFLLYKYKQQLTAQQSGAGTICQDRCMWECHRVFDRHFRAESYLTDKDFHCLAEIVDGLQARLQKPSLVLHLRAPVDVLVERIRQRGRVYEKEVTRNYLKRIEAYYEEWLGEVRWECPIIEMNTAHWDWRGGDWPRLLERIRKKAPRVLKG